MNVRKPNARFEQPNEILFSLKLFGSSQMSDNQKTVWNRFGAGFVFDKPNDFVQKSDSAEIRTV